MSGLSRGCCAGGRAAAAAASHQAVPISHLGAAEQSPNVRQPCPRGAGAHPPAWATMHCAGFATDWSAPAAVKVHCGLAVPPHNLSVAVEVGIPDTARASAVRDAATCLRRVMVPEEGSENRVKTGTGS